MNYNTDQKALIALADLEVPARKGYELWDEFGDGETMFAELTKSDYAKKVLGTLFPSVEAKFGITYAEDVIAECESRGVYVLTAADDDFPSKLADMLNPSYAMFCRGNKGLFETKCISVVGTRKYTAYGEAVAKTFSKTLAKHFTVVSGLAYGIDSIAHRTTLDEQGSTIAVLGSGVGDVYPTTNQSLAERIVAEGGLLISEYGLHSDPLSFHFPDRNRIVAALSVGVLVCESPTKSGTLLTARNAMDEGRDVFAVPGDIFLRSLRGGNELIKSGDAVCVTSPDDIIEYYGLDNDEEKAEFQLTFQEQAIVDVLQNGQSTFDKIVQITQILPAELNFLLAKLEIKSIISKLPGNSYRLTGGIK